MRPPGAARKSQSDRPDIGTGPKCFTASSSELRAGECRIGKSEPHGSVGAERKDRGEIMPRYPDINRQ